MKEPLNVEVEPFSEGKWARVERGVFAAIHRDAVVRSPRPDDGAWRHRRAFACIALLAAAALVFFVGRSVGRGWLPRGHAELARIVTSDGASRFTFGESTLEVDRDSMLLVRGDDEHGVSLIVDRGSVTCEVAPRHGRPPFLVDAGEVRVRVVGTRFTVARDGTVTRVKVDHGAVEVTSRGAVVMLHDGESWPAPVAHLATVPMSVATVAAPTREAVPWPPEPTRRAAPPVHPRRRRIPPAAAVTVAPSYAAPLAADLGSTPVSAPPPPPVTPTPAFVAPSAQSPGPTPQEQFELATGLERARPEQAETVYRQVAGTSSPWAANALFALARLKADHGEAPEARRLVDRYLALYPRGTNAADARELRDRLR